MIISFYPKGTCICIKYSQLGDFYNQLRKLRNLDNFVFKQGIPLFATLLNQLSYPGQQANSFGLIFILTDGYKLNVNNSMSDLN